MPTRARRVLLGVPEELLARVGAVSEEVAPAYGRRAVRERTGSPLGASSITGIARAGWRARRKKPVGLVYIALAGGGSHLAAGHAPAGPLHGAAVDAPPGPWVTGLDMLRRGRLAGLEVELQASARGRF